MELQNSIYPAKKHARRVAAALGVNEGLILLAGRESSTYDDSDMPPEFRQRRYFYYLTGAEDADCYVTYDIKAAVLTLFVPPQRSVREILYMGPVLTPLTALQQYNIDLAVFSKELDDFVDQYLKRGTTIYVLGRSEVSRLADRTVKCLQNVDVPSIDINTLKPAMNACRVIKDKWEIAAIREANRITTLAHTEVLKNITRLHNESGVEGVYVGTCIAAGAKSQAYSPICAAGSNAATLHYTANTSPLKSDQLLLIDAGAEYSCYASDVTRTFPVSPSALGYPTPEAEQIYMLVQDMQERCISKVKPGVLFRDLNLLAHEIAAEGLLKLGILHNGSKEEILQSGTSSAFFPHGLGHHLGLEVHDVEDAKRPMLNGGPASTDSKFRFEHLVSDTTSHSDLCRTAAGLRAGMVVTVEPGIYFNKYGLDKIYLKENPYRKYINVKRLEQYMHVGGVRIEDDILVTEDGYENLTTTPKGEEAIRIIRQGRK